MATQHLALCALFAAAACTGHGSESQATPLAAHLRSVKASADFRILPPGARLTQSESRLDCAASEHDPVVSRKYAVPNARRAATGLVRAWTARGWHEDQRSKLPGDYTVAKSFGSWSAGLSAYVVDAGHIEVSANILTEHCRRGFVPLLAHTTGVSPTISAAPMSSAIRLPHSEARRLENAATAATMQR